jgi:hypothetical protein
LELFEQAFELFRAGPLAKLAPHWIGTAPFLAALLIFLFEMSRGVFALERLLPMSFLLTILWVWMHVWQAVYCARLYATISSVQDARWDRGRIWSVVSIQMATQGMRLVAIPAALVIALPFAWTFSLFQNVTCFAGASRTDLPSAWRRAREAAGAWQRQCWMLIAITALLSITVFINVAVASYLSNQLVRSLLGITTPTANQPSAFLNSTFLMFVAAATYLLVDPILKAVYVVRCFAVESIRTGADLRVSLARIAQSTTVLLLMTASVPAQAVTREELDHAIDQVLREPEYRWRMSREPKPRADDSLLDRTADSMALGLRNAGRALGRFIDWLLDRLTGVDIDWPRGGAEVAGRRARTGLLILSAVLGAILIFLAWRLRSKATVKVVPARKLSAAQVVDLTDENISAAQFAEDEWLRLADEFLAKGETRLALRAVFLGALARLETDGFITLQRFKTNLDYDHELARRTRALPEVRRIFRILLHVFERCWYGVVVPDEATVRDMRSLLTRLKGELNVNA